MVTGLARSIDPSCPAMLDPVIHHLQHLLGWSTPVLSCDTSSSTPARLEYSSSFLKSIGKAQSKSTIPSYLWNRLEDLGIGKRFRSRRGGHRSRHWTGYPAAQAAGLLLFNIGLALPAPGQAIRESITVPSLLICIARSLAPKIDELQCIVANNEVDKVCVSEGNLVVRRNT